MKRIISVLVAVAVMAGYTFVSAFTDVAQSEGVWGSIDRLSVLGILNGYPDGSFKPEETITRAQFAKIAAIMLGEGESAVIKSVAGQFSDVGSAHWASGYIGVVAQNGVISGYIDGSFRPENTITHAEAITIAVRMLGFAAEDIGYRWPDGYIDKALAVGLVDSLAFDPYAPITRGEASILLDRALFADKKGSNDKLLANLHLKEVEDTVVIATQSVDPSLSSDMVSTSQGNFKKGNVDVECFIGQKTNLLIDSKTNKICYVEAQNLDLSRAIVENINSRDLLVKVNGYSQTIRIDDSVAIYEKGTKTTMGNKRASLQVGSELHIYSVDGNVDYVFLYEYDKMGPVTIKNAVDDIKAQFGISDMSDVKIVRDGYAAKQSDIQKYDIAYYNKGSKTVYLYSNKVTGVYEEAYPLKANVTSVTVSGKTYEIESGSAAQKLGESSGSYKIGDRVTLLLGEDGKIADAVTLNSLEPSDFCVVISTRTATLTENDEKGEFVYLTKVVTGDGYEVELKCKSSAAMFEGRFVRVTYNNGYADFDLINYNPIAGNIDRASMKIGAHMLAQNFTVLELVSDKTSGGVVVRKIDFADIKQNYLSSSDIIHAQVANDFNDVLVLFVNNITNSDYTYGMLTKSDVRSGNTSISASYKVMANGVTTSYSISGRSFSVYSGNPVAVRLSGGKLDHMYALTAITTGARVEKVEAGRIKLKSGSVYTLADDVQIFKYVPGSDYTQLSIAELSETDKSVSLYAERSVQNGGIIRVIVVK